MVVMKRVFSWRPGRGFTLVEFVIVIVVIGILAAVVVTNLGARAQHSVTTQADQFRRDLSRAQLLAISQGKRLKLTVTATSYSVCLASTATCDATGAMSDPTLDTPSGKFHVALEDPVRFTQGAGTYYFDSLGRPITVAGALLTAAMSFGLNGAGRSNDATVAVLPITGFAQIAY